MRDFNLSTTFRIYESSEELSDLDLQLLKRAVEMREKAYAPYSDFHVGAAVLLQNKEVFLGNNQENAAYPSGICAERVAIWSAMASMPDEKILKIFISARSSKTNVDKPVAPCGACRQAIAEYETKQSSDIEIFFTGESGQIVMANSIKDLLPWMFDNSML